MTSRAMRRAVRSSQALRRGTEILEMILSSRRALVEAAKQGVPPVIAISNGLVEVAGKRDAKLLPVKSFAGLCVRAVLEEEGFSVIQTGVRLKDDPVFRTGSVYARQANVQQASKPLLERLVAVLTKDEAEQLSNLLRQRLG